MFELNREKIVLRGFCSNGSAEKLWKIKIKYNKNRENSKMMRIQ